MENKNEFVRPQKNFKSDGSLLNSQKLALFGLGVFAIGVFVLWGVEFRNNIFNPLNLKTEKKANQCLDGSCQNSQVASEVTSENLDTDKDGLSDQDELNKYGTSPYLADSDGDGINDKIEVENNTNPLCPQGRDCSLLGELVAGVNTAVSSSTEVSTEEDIIKANAAILRQALLETKTFNEEELNKISDRDLLSAYQIAVEGSDNVQE